MTNGEFTRRNVLMGAGVGISAICSAGFAPAMATDLQSVDMALGTVPDYTHYYLADALDIWKTQNLKANTTMFSAGRLALEALVAGRVHVATCAEVPAVFAAVNGLPVRVIGSTIRYEPFDLVAGPSLRSLDHLKGKKIAYAQGTNAHFYLDRLVVSRGLTWGDITPVNMQVGDFIAALASGAIDGFVWSEPLISAALKQSPAVQRLRSPGLYFAYGCLVTMQPTLEKSTDVLVKVMRALLKTDEVLKAEPANAQSVLAERLKMDRDVVKNLWGSLAFGVTMDRATMVRDFELQAQWAANNKLARGDATAVDFNTVVVADIFDRAKSAA